MITWSEAQRIFQTMLHWWWLLILAVALASGAAFYLSKNEPQFYVARATLMIGNAFESTRPDPNQLAIGSSLAKFYGELARREPILKQVQEEMQLPFPWQMISDKMLATNVVPSANLLEISIVDSNPERAAAIANEIGKQLIAYSPTSQEKIQTEQQAIEHQIEETNTRIEGIKKKIADLTERQQQVNSAGDLAEINQTLTELNASLEQEQSSYNSLLLYKNNSIANSLSFFEQATAPIYPIPSKRKQVVAIAGLAGLMLASLAIFILEQLSNRWSGSRDIKGRFGMPNLGHLPAGPLLFMAGNSADPQRERAVREIHTNILLATAERGVRTLQISSPQPSAERIAFSIDLAYLFARAGHRVVLVDADLLEPRLTHKLYAENCVRAQEITESNTSEIRSHLYPTTVDKLMLLPGRHADASNGIPALIPALHWSELVQQLLSVASIVIFDGPSALSGADAALLAPHVDGVVLALTPSSDTRNDVLRSKTRLLHLKGTQLLGAVTCTAVRQQSEGVTLRIPIPQIRRQQRSTSRKPVPALEQQPSSSQEK